MQSTTTPELAFGLVAPPLAVENYRIELRPGDLTALELDDERSALVYVILNRGEVGGLTVNLQGPVVINPVRRLGRQLVLTSSRYAVRYPLGESRRTSSRTYPAAWSETASRHGMTCREVSRRETIPSPVVVFESRAA